MSEDHREAGHASSAGNRSGWGKVNPRYLLLLGGGLAIIALGITLRIAGELAWGIYALAAFVVSGIGLLGIACFPFLADDPQQAYPETQRPDPVDLTDPMRFTEGDPSPSSPPRSRPERFGYGSGTPLGRSAGARSISNDPLGASPTPSAGFPSEEPGDPFPMEVLDFPGRGEPTVYCEGALLLSDPSGSPKAQEWEPVNALSMDTQLVSPTSGPSQDVGSEPAATPGLDPPTVASGPISLDVSATAAQVGAPVASTPPFARAKAEHVAPTVPRPTSGLRVPPRSNRCANCRKPVRDPKIWRRCPDCQHQLCTHCIVEALLAYEGAWCTHCAGLRHLDALAKELLPPAGDGNLGTSPNPILERVTPPTSLGPRDHVNGPKWKGPHRLAEPPPLRGSDAPRRSTLGKMGRVSKSAADSAGVPWPRSQSAPASRPRAARAAEV